MAQRPPTDAAAIEDADSIIRTMPDALANKIAAGEVVGRPASVVKELVENAIDAGATRIEIQALDSGRTSIQVTDNGVGMSRHDAVHCFGRHATSKIRSFEDLERIGTLGFRGEALASIAGVARVELRTRRATDDLGTRVVVEGGDQSEPEPCGVPQGTSLTVRQLFYNVPARRAFLKSDATELSHILETIQGLAIANPKVGFSLSHDGRELLKLRACQGDNDEAAVQRIGDLFGHKPQDLLPVEERTSYLGIRGWIGQPEVRKGSRGEQYLLVNGRPIKSRYLEHAVYGAYQGLIPDRSFPFFVLFLDVDARHVDVNVHPAKAEVKFDDERGVYSMLRAVVGRALSEGAGVLRLDSQAVDLLGGSTAEGGGATGQTGTASDTPHLNAPRGDGGRGGGGEYQDPRRGAPGVAVGEAGRLSQELYAPRPDLPAPSHSGSVPANDAHPETLVWQVLASYIVAPIRSGLMVLDQQAAHERVIYEQAGKALDDGFGLSQQLLFPTVVEFSPADFALLEGLLPDLRAIGFDVAPMSGRSVMVRGLPADIRSGDERQVLAEVLDEYKQVAQRMRLASRELLARALARRSAIPRETRLEPAEMRALIDKLFQCVEPYTSPGGQPTMIRITGEELARRFGNRS